MPGWLTLGRALSIGPTPGFLDSRSAIMRTGISSSTVVLFLVGHITRNTKQTEVDTEAFKKGGRCHASSDIYHCGQGISGASDNLARRSSFLQQYRCVGLPEILRPVDRSQGPSLKPRATLTKQRAA